MTEIEVLMGGFQATARWDLCRNRNPRQLDMSNRNQDRWESKKAGGKSPGPCVID